MEVNQVMLQEHCFVYWLVYASLGVLWEFHGMRAENEGEGRRKKTLNSTHEKERGGARGKNICSNLDFKFFGDLFWKSLV